MSRIRTRPAEPADEPRLIRICVAAQAGAFPGWPSDMATPAEYAQQTRDEQVWVGLHHDRPAGLASIHRRRFLHHLYVDPALQGRGIGRALLDRVTLETGGRFSLKCDLANRPACAFYQARGLRPREWGWAPTGPWVRFAR
jgi:GNAT superfamily N-acetyltransferase